MDSIPRHNQNTVDFRALVNDSVSGADNGIKASTDGTHFSAEAVNIYLTHAYAWLTSLFVSKLGPDETAMLMPQTIKNHEFSTSSGGTALRADRLGVYTVRKATTSNVYKQITHAQYYDDKDFFLTYAFFEFENKIFIVERITGVLSLAASGLIEYEYFKAERRDQTTGAIASPNTQANNSDITMDLQWHPVCVRYAAMLGCLDKGTAEWTNQAKSIQESVKLLLPKGLF